MSDKLKQIKQQEVQAARRETLDELIDMFTVKEKWWREAIQNGKGANASRMDIQFSYNEEVGMYDLVVEDNGEGMGSKERDHFLLKLFSSSKEDDPDRPGRFGIGVVSAFAYKPHEFIVESSNGAESWRVVVDGEDYGLKLYKAPPRKGTKITLRLPAWTSDIDEMEAAAREAIIQDCSYMEMPIYFQGESVNRDFSIDGALAQVHFQDDLLEGVLAVTKNDPLTRLFNNRIRLQDRDIPLEEFYGGDYEISALINSKFLSFNLSRNEIKRDGRYEEVMARAKEHIDDLVVAAYQTIADIDPATIGRSGPVWTQISTLWDFVLQRVRQQERDEGKKEKKRKKRDRKVLPESLHGMLDVPMFEAWNMDRKLTLGEVLNCIDEEGTLYTRKFMSKVVDTLIDQGQLVLKRGHGPPGKGEDQKYKLLGEFAHIKNADQVFYMPMVLREEDLTEQEGNFLAVAREQIAASPLAKQYDELVLGDFSQETGKVGRTKPFMLLSDSGSARDRGRKPLFSTAEQKIYKKRFEGRKTMVLNKNSEYIQQLVTLSTTPKNHLAYYFLMQALALPSTYHNEGTEHLELYSRETDR